MSGQDRAAWRRARLVISRLAVWAVLIAVFLVLAFAVVLWPTLLLAVLAGASVGLVVRFTIKRRRAPGKGPQLSRQATGPGRGYLLLLIIGTVGVVAIATGSFTFGAGVYLKPRHPARPLRTPTHRVTYQADLDFEAKGDWSGLEWFTLKRAEAKALVRAGKRPIEPLLQAAVPSGWKVHPDTTGNVTVYRIQRAYPSHPFHVPSWRPLTISTSLPAPELRSPRFRYPIFAGKGSMITLHAPEHRVRATAPSSSASPEAGAREVRVVKLEVIGAHEAGSGVDIEIESDLARQLPQTWVGHGILVVFASILGSLGFTLAGAWGFVWRFLKRLFKGGKAPLTKSVLRGKRSKNAALTSYLEGRGLSAEDERSAINSVVHEARRLATETITDSSEPGVRAKYDAAVLRMRAEGKLPELDVVYAALKEAGISSDELDALDTALDKAIIAGQES